MLEPRWAIVVGRFYEELADKLVEGAGRVFESVGGDVDVFPVPGAFELPLGAKYCAESRRYRGVACLGAVIRGETDHYDHVAGAVTSGVAQVGLQTGVPTIFGILTTDTVEQALNRAGLKSGNNGHHAAVAAIEMASLLAKIGR